MKISNKIPNEIISFSLITFLSFSFFTSCSVKSDDKKGEKKEESLYQSSKSEREESGFKGNVKVVKQEEFYCGNSEDEIGNRTGLNSFSYRYDETGKRIEEQYYDSLGIISRKSEYLFSGDKKKIGKNIFDLDNNLLSSYKYEYDEFGRVVRINITDYKDKEKFDYYKTSEYDSYGNEIKSVTFTPDGEKFQSAIYEFQNNLKVKTTLLDNMDSPYAICEFKHNQRNDVIKEIFYDGNGLLFEEYSIVYLYDDKNNWIKKIYTLEKKHTKSSSNSNRNPGVQTITLRTLTYY
jgi:hypothetical protein